MVNPVCIYVPRTSYRKIPIGSNPYRISFAFYYKEIKIMKLNFKGCIDCNTEFILDDISLNDYNVIKKFITALDRSNCSYINATTTLICENDEILSDEY